MTCTLFTCTLILSDQCYINIIFHLYQHVYIYTVIIHHFRNDEEAGAKMSCAQYRFWNHYWGLPGQLLAHCFPCPQ